MKFNENVGFFTFFPPQNIPCQIMGVSYTLVYRIRWEIWYLNVSWQHLMFDNINTKTSVCQNDAMLQSVQR